MTGTTDTFVYDRTFPLPPARMWVLLTDAKMREQWGAPGEGNMLEVIASDMRVGGEEHHRCGPADNPEFEVRTRWYHLTEPEIAVYTEVIEAGGAQLGASLVTYQLEAHDGGSKLLATVAVSSFVGPEMMDEFRAGWDGGMEKLEGLAAKEAS